VHQGRPCGELFQWSTLVSSLFIGFVARAPAMIVISDTSTPREPDKQMIVRLLGAG